MRLNEGSKIPLAITCLALCAAVACSKKEEPASEIKKVSKETAALAMRPVEKDVRVEPPKPVETVKPPVKPSRAGKQIDIKDLPVADWYKGAKYDGCKKLDPKKENDFERMMEDCEFYDPNSPDGRGSPVLDLRGHYNDRLGPYFKISEFAKIDPADLQYVNPGHRETTDDGVAVYRFARIDPAIVSLMNEIREEAGFPIFIDGGFRPYYHNVRMYQGQGGGVKSKSQHVSGGAVDVDLNSTFEALREKCGDPGFAKSDKGKTACRLKNKPVLSEHLFGTAYEIMQNRGGGGIGMGDTQIHFDSRNGGRVATWGYNSWNRKMIERLMKTPGRGRR